MDQMVVQGGEAENARMRAAGEPFLEVLRVWAREIPLNPSVDPSLKDVAVESEAMFLATGCLLHTMLNQLLDRQVPDSVILEVLHQMGKAIGSTIAHQDDEAAETAYGVILAGMTEGHRACRASLEPRGTA